MNKPSDYIVTAGLEAAFQVALDLGMPLLLTGEPGTGKTEFSKWAAIQLDTQVLRFNTKTTSIAKDLFYRYDAIRHFREAQNKTNQTGEVNPLDYVNIESLGLAIMASAALKQRFVVLVDEIDKAPRDFPNDLLFEFEELAFRIEEANNDDFKDFDFSKNFLRQGLAPLSKNAILPDTQGFIRRPKDAPKPLLILTSNSEKNLPDAFLRRCIFFHIDFPNAETLAKIVRARVHLEGHYDLFLDNIVAKFRAYREQGMRKQPATAELIQWVKTLVAKGIDPEKLNDAETKTQLLATFPILAKNKDDFDKLSKAS